MDNAWDTCSPRHQLIWGIFLLAVAGLWALSSAGIISTAFWRFAGPLALLAVSASMVWRRAA